MKNIDDLKLIVLDNCKEFGQKVDKHLQKIRKNKNSYIVPVKLTRFNNGEAKACITKSIRGKDVYIISDIGNYSCTYKMFDFLNHMSPDDHYQDIKRIILSTMGHAKSVNVVMPLLYEARQHRRKGRESLDCALALQELERLGIKGIITFDVHDPNIQNAIPNLPCDNFFTTNDTLKDFLNNEVIETENLLVISPDMGAMERARYLAEILKVDVGMFYKRRDLSKIIDGKNPVVAHEYLGKNVKDKDIIIVDDMIASGGSMIDVARELKQKKAKKIYCFATYALFTQGYEIFDDTYAKGWIDKIYTSNLSYIPENIKNKEWLHIVDCSLYAAHIIDTLNKDESITDLIEYNSARYNFYENDK